MTSVELALICSSSPGFLRGTGTVLGQHFRLIECYTLQESTRMIRLHQPQLVIIDLRGAHEKLRTRTWSTVETAADRRFIVVVVPGQSHIADLPVELNQLLEFVELEQDARDMTALIRQALTPDSTPPSLPAPLEADCRTPGDEGDNPGNDHRDQQDQQDQVMTIADRFRTRTPELRQMLKRLEVAARHHVTLLLIGETGSGKTHLARLIHDCSPRAGEPFLHVACGALPSELMESELFGHVRGAFTSAHADKDGKFLVAGNGTILLDEIDVLAPDQQVKLLRVIEKGEFEPVGSNRTLHVRARIIAASNLPLLPLVEKGRFRPDLYYRLNTLSFIIPPLRRRLPDVEPLARYFVHRHAAQLGIDVVDISQTFLDCLLSYHWPGNVRELENAVRSAVIYSCDGKITPDTLPSQILEGTAAPSPDQDSTATAFFAVRRRETLENRIGLTEKDIIQQALLNNNYSRTNTARHLGISRVTLYNKMRKHGILLDR